MCYFLRLRPNTNKHINYYQRNKEEAATILQSNINQKNDANVNESMGTASRVALGIENLAHRQRRTGVLKK